MANSHDDTTEGAVHYFQDERGNWHSYTFTEKSAGTTGTSNQVLSIAPEPGLPLNSQYHSSTLSEFRCDRPNLSNYDGISLTPPTANEPRQSTSLSLSAVGNTACIGNQGTVLKTPSSSESWTSVSSNELTVDTTTNKMYASYRRNPHQHHHRGPSASTHGHSRNQSQSGSPSPIPSVPSLVTITPEYTSVSASASTHALSTRLPMPSYSSMQRSWQRNRRDVLQVLTESLRGNLLMSLFIILLS